MIVGQLYGMLVIWRSPGDRDAIRDWGIYQTPLEAHALGYAADIVCDTRVPIFAASNEVLREDMLRAKELLTTTLVNMVRERSDLRRIRDQFGHVRAKFGDGGRPKPEVAVVDEDEFARIFSQAVFT